MCYSTTSGLNFFRKVSLHGREERNRCEASFANKLTLHRSVACCEMEEALLNNDGRTYLMSVAE